MISERTIPSRPQATERRLTLSLGNYWHRVALFAIVALSAMLNFVGLSREGYDNEFYAAAVKSMSESWHNFFFNSFDPGGFVTGLIAALALAVTPISVVTNRNNTIDSTLVLVILLGAWAVLRAAETGKLRWLLLCAVFVGLGFNIKMLEAYLVLPAFGLVYLLGTPRSLWRRIANLGLAAVVLLAVSLSWVTAVDMTAASQRPWVDSTTTNSALDLAIGYNGLQRLTGNHSVSSAGTRPTSNGAATSSVGPGNGGGPGGNGGPGGIGENGPTGFLRLLDTQLGSQIGWLLPLAVLGLMVGLWQTRPQFRILDDRQRSLVLWGAWLLTTGAFFSVALFFHTYYLVMMAPAVSALAGIAVVSLWRAYRRPGSKTWMLLPLCLLLAAGVQAHLLANYPSWARWLTPLVVGACVLAAIGLIALRLRHAAGARAAVMAAALAVLALMTSPTAFAAYTMQHTQTGAILRAGPTASGISGSPGRFAGGPQSGSGMPPGGRFGPPPGGSLPGGRGHTGAAQFGRPFGRPGNGGGPGGGQASRTLLRYLVKHRGAAKYLVATPSSNEAAPIIIATGEPVMSLGGFTGSDPILTSAKLASLAKEGVVQYFLLGGGGGPGGGNGLTTWIQQHSKLVTVGGTQLYEYTG